jgi:hypothetical protein
MVRQFKSIEEVRDYILDLQSQRGNIIVKMMFGNGDKKQFKDVEKLKKEIDYSISMTAPINRTIYLYFGDVSKEKEPDIGYAFKYLSEIRPDIIFIMIQIKEMEKHGVPDFVNGGVFFHSDYDEKHKWGGFEKDENGKYQVYSNTKQWLKLHYLLYKDRLEFDNERNKYRSRGIRFCDVFGEGGNITKQELELIFKINDIAEEKDIHDFEITYHQYDLESRYETQSKDWKDKTKI